MSPFPLVIGIDGGGSHTLALLARADTGAVVGQGEGGPSNICSVGEAAGVRALDDAVGRAFAAAGVPRARVAAACLGLAGIDHDSGLDVILGWATRVGLAERVEVANDSALLLAAGTADGWGLAVIAGTGSIAFARAADGKAGRSGGWGYVLGDEGSAYMLALAALRAVCRAYDRCGPATGLTDQFIRRMGVAEPTELIPAVYRGAWDRAAIAGLAPLVLEAAAAGDTVAESVVKREAHELSLTAASAVRTVGLAPVGVPVALAGGVFLGSEHYRRAFLGALAEQGVRAGEVRLVPDPAVGAVVLARRNVEPLRGS